MSVLSRSMLAVGRFEFRLAGGGGASPHDQRFDFYRLLLLLRRRRRRRRSAVAAVVVRGEGPAAEPRRCCAAAPSPGRCGCASLVPRGNGGGGAELAAWSTEVWRGRAMGRLHFLCGSLAGKDLDLF